VTHIEKLQELGYNTKSLSLGMDGSSYLIDGGILLNIDAVEKMVAKSTANKQ